MPQVTVKATYVNQPNKIPDFGSIKGDDGNYYNIPKDRLADFKQGNTYTFEYSAKAGKNGKTYYDFQRFVNEAGPAPKPATNGNGNGRAYDASPETAERIFVCGVVNGWAHAGLIQMNPDDLSNAVLAARQAWRDTFGAA